MIYKQKLMLLQLRLKAYLANKILPSYRDSFVFLDKGSYSPSLIFISKNSQQVGHIVAIFL